MSTRVTLGIGGGFVGLGIHSYHTGHSHIYLCKPGCIGELRREIGRDAATLGSGMTWCDAAAVMESIRYVGENFETLQQGKLHE